MRGVAKDWFISYLHNRKQHVSIGTYKSDDLCITHGVPQGSVLGPLLFFLYINDFSNCCSYFDFHVFADDTNLFCANSSPRVLEYLINDNLKRVSLWLHANKLSLNIDKTNFIIFHPRQKVITYQVRLHIASEQLKQVKRIRYLGVHIDSYLTWKYNLQHITKKIKRSVGILAKIRHYLPISILLQLYYTLIYPYLTYAVTTWDNTYAITLKPLITLQKKAIRLISFSEFRAHTSPLFAHLKILKFSDLIFLNNALLMYDFHENNLPSVFHDFFTPESSVHKYNTRLASKDSYYISKVRTNYGKFNIRFVGAKVWNSIDESFKSKRRNQFKKLVTSNILNTYLDI